MPIVLDLLLVAVVIFGIVYVRRLFAASRRNRDTVRGIQYACETRRFNRRLGWVLIVVSSLMIITAPFPLPLPMPVFLEILLWTAVFVFGAIVVVRNYGPPWREVFEYARREGGVSQYDLITETTMTAEEAITVLRDLEKRSLLMKSVTGRGIRVEYVPYAANDG